MKSRFHLYDRSERRKTSQQCIYCVGFLIAPDSSLHHLLIRAREGSGFLAAHIHHLHVWPVTGCDILSWDKRPQIHLNELSTF